MTKIVGILNVTDDSFADSTHYNTTEKALARFEELLAQGADFVDIGAEKTSYGATPLSAAEEWSKLEPILKTITLRDKVSIDTYHTETARKAIDLGYSFINDVAGGKTEGMLELIAAHPHVQYVLMHNLVIPADRKFRIKNVSEMYDWAKLNISKCMNAGIKASQLSIDPGLGFTTFPNEAFEIIKNCEKLKEFGVKTYIGNSRKSIFDDMTELHPSQRDTETLVCSLYMYGKVDFLRVHNVEMHTRAIRVQQRLKQNVVA